MHNISFSHLAPYIVTITNYTLLEWFHNLCCAVCTLQFTFFQPILQSRNFLQVLHSKPLVFIEHNILASFKVMAMTKQFYWYLYVSSMCNEFPSHVVCAFWNGGGASVSANKVYGIANSIFCFSPYMLTQFITDYVILKRTLLASSVFSPVFPVFYIEFLLSYKRPAAQQYFISVQSSPHLNNQLPEDQSYF